jgi:hypothetical protein
LFYLFHQGLSEIELFRKTPPASLLLLLLLLLLLGRTTGAPSTG